MNEKIYVELLKKVLVDYYRLGSLEYKPLHYNNRSVKLKFMKILDSMLRKRKLSICRVTELKEEDRIQGKDCPAYADTMIGLKRLDNIEFCVKKILEDNIPGDFIETGVWRGGATIFMKALVNLYDVKGKIVWVADSFEGLPRPNSEKYRSDIGDAHYVNKELAIGLEIVKGNFEKYGLLDDKVKFLKGWFKDTLPAAPIEKLSLVRLDGDMYESTMDGLINLYPKLSDGGYIIIDDWGAVKGCKEAVLDYRKEHGIVDEIENIDWTGVFWRKSKRCQREQT